MKTIGADELILRLRKNGNETSNKVLGKRLRKTIEKKLKMGKIDAKNSPAEWSKKGRTVGEFRLPKTSAQYKITDTDKLGKLYDELSTW